MYNRVRRWSGGVEVDSKGSGFAFRLGGKLTVRLDDMDKSVGGIFKDAESLYQGG